MKFEYALGIGIVVGFVGFVTLPVSIPIAAALFGLAGAITLYAVKYRVLKDATHCVAE